MLPSQRYTLGGAIISIVSNVALHEVICFVALESMIHLHMVSDYVPNACLSTSLVLFCIFLLLVLYLIAKMHNLAQFIKVVLTSSYQDRLSHLSWCNTIATSSLWCFFSFFFDMSCFKHAVMYFIVNSFIDIISKVVTMCSGSSLAKIIE